MKKKSFAIVLSGCGVYDGAEIHEAVFTMLAIDQQGADYQLFAPNISQMHVVDHLSGNPTKESRNVLVEAARIARGKITSLAEYKAQSYDGLIFPGGFGVAKNLCTFALEGTNCAVDPIVEQAITETHKASKPIGALCISPVLIAKVLQKVDVTIGTDKETAEAILAFGATHSKTNHGEVVVDRKNKIVTTPCYMLDSTIKQIYDGAFNLVEKVMELS
ncbi:MAG: isoprenoid biosynthesis glyoxalase ElbB [Salinivirgaceae bacterium]|nr:isoprenoid biosynthesis glyoxalase ElbB [Salinivirgaceae bacterium]MDD4745919.1 isoprenoid biosynthesis glyoxalase ElbB [Salinivirgaceae bacterium]MDY0279725.1 isoprenoid biosynthesis glyoxalase ElbB [Salinivirgaceae bacterium]